MSLSRIHQQTIHMAFLKHENIKVLHSNLNWQKNGILKFVATTLSNWIAADANATPESLRLSPVRSRS